MSLTPRACKMQQDASSLVRRLNPCDRLMYYTNQVLQSAGGVGLLNQTQVWTHSRLDANALRLSLKRLGRLIPALASRLRSCAGTLCWDSAIDAECELHETSLLDAQDVEAFRFSSQLMSLPMDLESGPPITFHLLHFPDERDVFLIHNDHTLMDIGGVGPLLLALQQFAGATDDQFNEPLPEVDSVRSFLQRFPLRARLSAVAFRMSVHRRIARSPAITLVDGSALKLQPGCKQVWISRVLANQELQIFRDRVHQTRGLPSPSMVLLASVFRAMDRFVPPEAHHRDRYTVTLGVDLRSRRARPAVGNMASVLTMSVTRDQLADRGTLICELMRQKKDRVSHGYEIGSLQLGSWFSRFPRIVRRRVRRTLANGPSLVYGYITWPREMDHTLCGAPIDRIHQAVSVHSPPGLGLVASDFADKVTLTATFTPETVPEDTVNRLMEIIVDDLTGAA